MHINLKQKGIEELKGKLAEVKIHYLKTTSDKKALEEAEKKQNEGN